MRSLEQLGSLKGRRALITGAAGNLGSVFAETLAELGANLLLVDLPNKDMRSLENNLVSKFGITVELISCNLEDETSRSALISNLLAQNLTLDILINNAAFVGTSDLADINSKFEGQSLSSFRRILEVNLNSVFHLCQGLLPLLNKSQSGSIINISSIYGSFGPDWNLYSGTGMSNSAAYSSSKGAVNQLTRWLATTLSPKIRVNSISPGGIARNQPRDFIEKYEKRTPLGRMAVEEDFKGVISFLASDNSSYVTGQNIYVDGGWSAW